MKKTILMLTILLGSLTLSSQTENYNTLLKKYVVNGKVDYQSIQKNKKDLDIYLSYLNNTVPDSTWSNDKKKAFWLNAYNAYTIKIIADNYPPKKTSSIEKHTEDTKTVGFTISNTKKSSITYIREKGKDAWNIPFAKVGGKVHTLNQIEHGILRKQFNDGRIHVGLNAASISGPQFANFAFTEENVNNSLEILMIHFINDSTKNKISDDKVELSKVFEWYSEDFNLGDVLSYISKYVKTSTINQDAMVSYLKYNWELNNQ